MRFSSALFVLAAAGAMAAPSNRAHNNDAILITRAELIEMAEAHGHLSARDLDTRSIWNIFRRKRCNKKSFNACTNRCYETPNGLGGAIDMGCINRCVASHPGCKYKG